MSTTQPVYYVSYGNHFDLIWRRGWQRAYTYQGLVYRPYADVEEAWITRCLRLAEEEGAAFQLEQSLSLRMYLTRHPETLPVLQRLYREGRFEVLGGGEAVIDVNMCGAETMARNFASGIRYVRALFGEAPQQAHHGDGFGSSAQFPQVARLCGLRGIGGLSYCKPDGPYWRGLDGSTVCVSSPGIGYKGFFYDHCYYEPCVNCKGAGQLDETACPRCEGTGLRLSQGVYPPREWGPELQDRPGIYSVCSEEMMPDAALPAQIIARNAEGGTPYVWQTGRVLWPRWEELLARVDAPDLPLSSRVENNPTQTGTLVDRIRVKQAVRRAEGRYYAAEALAALVTHGDAVTGQALEAHWLHLPVLCFHDAITGTHNDPAQEELLDLADEVVMGSTAIADAAVARVLPGAVPITCCAGATTLAVFNPHGVPADLLIECPATGDGCQVTDADGAAMPLYRQPGDTDLPLRAFAPVGPDRWAKLDAAPPTTVRFLATNVPPLGTKLFEVTPVGPPASPPARLTSFTQLESPIECGNFQIGWNEHGVHSLIERASGGELLNSAAGPLGQLLVEHDEGDPWGTRSLERQRVNGAGMSRLLGAYRRGDAVEIVTAGQIENGSFGRETDPNIFGLEWYQTVRVLDGVPWVEVETEIFWQAVNRRIRLAFPSRAVTDRGLYHIPHGVLTRERYEQTETCLWSPNGDWPTLHFAATEPHDGVPGLAVINTGTPAARIEDGMLLYSVLRSPGFGHCLTRYAQDYPMPTDGMRDGGHHRFRFAVMPYTGDNLAEILQHSQQYNVPALCWQVPRDTPTWTSGLSLLTPGVTLDAVKCAYAGGLAVRITEGSDLARDVMLTVPEWVTHAATANLLEDESGSLPINAHTVCLPVTPYSIHTVVLR